MVKNRSRLALLAIFGIAPALWAAPKGTLLGELAPQGEWAQKDLSTLKVRLSIFQKERENAGAETTVLPGGKFRFANLDTGPEFSYQARIDWGSLPFRSERVGFEKGSTATKARIALYPVTGSPESLSINEIVLFEFGRADVVRINHSLVIENRGEKTYDARAPEGRAIEIPLKEGGFGLELGRGLSGGNTSLDSAGNKLQLRLPVRSGPDGTERIDFSYLYSYPGRSLQMEIPVAIARERLSVLIRDRDFPVKGERFKTQPPYREGKSTFYIHSVTDLKAGEKVTFTLTSLPRSSDVPRGLLFVGVGLTLFAGIFLWIRRPKHLPDQDRSDRERERCLTALVELEKGFERGSIPPGVYRREKERMYELLAERLTAPGAAG